MSPFKEINHRAPLDKKIVPSVPLVRWEHVNNQSRHEYIRSDHIRINFVDNRCSEAVNAESRQVRRLISCGTKKNCKGILNPHCDLLSAQDPFTRRQDKASTGFLNFPQRSRIGSVTAVYLFVFASIPHLLPASELPSNPTVITSSFHTSHDP